MRFYLGLVAAFVTVVAAILIAEPERLISNSKILEESSSSIPDQVRANANVNFAAAEMAVAFPVPLSRDTGGIVFFDRTTQVAKLIVEPEVYLASPHFSPDGKRILLVSGPTNTKPRQLLSCEIATWKCSVLWETNNTIFSPVYLNGETILFSSSPLITEGANRERFSRHNFLLLRANGDVDPLLDIGFYQLSSFSFSESILMFTAVGASKPDFIDENPSRRTAGSRSDIYSVSFDLTARHITAPSKPLEPLFLLEGFSSFPTISSDGGIVTFLNQPSTSQAKFDLVIATSDGSVLRRIESEGSFSRARITKTEIIANELGKSAYRVHVFSRGNFEKRVIFELKFKPDEIRKLETQRLEILAR